MRNQHLRHPIAISLVASLILTLTLLSAQDSAISGRSLESYQRYIASGKNVSVWEGKRTALVLDSVDDPSTYDQEVMTELVGVFDKVFAA
jgi:hypothetical protein